MLRIEIPLLPRSKKNSQSIIINPKTHKPKIIQSKLYQQYEKDCALFMPKLENSISCKVNLKCTFIVPDKRKRDLTNLENAIADILVKYKVLEDDNYNIINSWDGSRIVYKKGIEKTIIEIDFLEG